MGITTVTIEIPGTLFQQLKRRAEVLHRPVEELVAQTLELATPSVDLPPELAAEMEAMLNFSDEALWAATHPAISTAEQARLAQVNELANQRELSAPEHQEQAQLLEAWQRSLARRARAFAILKMRGHRLPTPAELQAELELSA